MMKHYSHNLAITHLTSHIIQIIIFINQMEAYYKTIKHNTDTSKFNITWQEAYLQNITTHSPNAHDKYNLTFYQLLGAMTDSLITSKQFFGESIDLDELNRKRNIIYEATNDKEIAVPYSNISKTLYLAGYTNPNILDPKRNDHYDLYCMVMINAMILTHKYNYSVFDNESNINMLLHAIFHTFHYVDGGIPPFIPKDTILNNLVLINHTTFAELLKTYNNYYLITYEQVLSSNSPEHICVYLQLCDELPQNLDISCLKDHMINTLSQIDCKDDFRLAVLIELYMKTFPDVSIQDIINKFQHVPKILLEFLPYSINIPINTTCLICFQQFDGESPIYHFKCGHGVCKKCMEEYKSLQCPYLCEQQK